MSTPTITILGIAPDRVQVADSARVHAELSVSGIPASGQAEVAFIAAAAPAFVLRGGGATLALALPAVGATAPLGHITHAGTTWDVTWALAADPGPTTDRRLTVTLLDPAALAPTATFTLEVAASAPMALVDVSGPSMSVGEIEADPLVTLSGPTTISTEELKVVALSATAIRITTASPPPAARAALARARPQAPGPTSVILTPAPQTPSGAACKLDASFVAPSVSTALTFRFTATAGAFTSSVTVTVNVTMRARRSMIVLDRSGSMHGARWTNAVRAAHIWLDVVAGIRRGVNANDRVGILVFDDLQHGFRNTGGPSDRIKIVEPASGAIGPLPDPPPATLSLQLPAAMTPIGDALIVSLNKLLEGLAVGTEADQFYSLLLLTDGYENSGTVRVDAASPPPGGALFDTVKSQGARSSFTFTGANANIRVYPVGVGPGGVQEDVLDNLAYGNSDAVAPNGVYHLISSVADLSPGFAQIGAHDYGGASLQPSATPSALFGPDAGVTNAAYIVVPSKESRLVIVMLKAQAADTLQLAKRGAGGAFEAVPAVALTTWTRTTHVTAVVDLTQAGLNAASTEWRVQRTSAGPALTVADVIAVRDLAFVADVAFDRVRYRSGTPMVVSAKLRHLGVPVTGATIRVELVAPGESLGTTLATGAQLLPNGGAAFVAGLAGIRGKDIVDRPDDDHGNAAGGGAAASPDPLHPKAAMLQAILAARGLTELPMTTPPSVFEDSTDVLHGVGASAAGDYVNRFVRTDKEGTYTLKFSITGTLPDGSPFADTFTVSRWVGIEVDAAASPVAYVQLTVADPSRKAIEITITPKSRTGELLGPFRSNTIAFRTNAGTFKGPIVTHPDGRYSRVLEYGAKENPVVVINVEGVELRPVATGGGCMRFIDRIRKLLGL